MKNIIKIFLLLIINLLLINLTDFTTNASMIEKSSKTRLNKVIKKVSIKDDDKRKNFLILLVNLKSKYKDSSDIEGMINYLENNVCAKSTYTQTKINTAINDIISKFKNEGYEKIKTEIIAGIKLLEANPYNAIGVRCQVALYDNINENKIFGKYERGYLVEADIDNYITNNYSEDVDNTDNITDNDSTDSDNSTNDNTSNTQVCDEKTKKEINEKYPSVYKNINFKNRFNANVLKKSNEVYPHFNNDEYYEFGYSNKTSFKAFLPKGAKKFDMVIFFTGWPSNFCSQGATIHYWIGKKEKPLEKGLRPNDLWNEKYLEVISTMEDTGLSVYAKDIQPSNQATWVYFEINIPSSCPSYNKVQQIYTLDLDKYSDWYNNEAKWEANGDPAYDCGGNNVSNNTINNYNTINNENNVTTNTIVTNKCSDPNKVDQNKYFSVYDNQATGGNYSSGKNGDIFLINRFYFKKEMNPYRNGVSKFTEESLSIFFAEFGIPFSGQKNIEVEGVSVSMKTMYFKQFIPPGVSRVDLISYFSSAGAYDKCDTNIMKMKYWVGPVQPKEEINPEKEGTIEKLARFWKGDMTFVKMSGSWTSDTIGFYPPNPEWTGWVYFAVEFPNMACCNGGYTYPHMTPVFHFKSVENFEKYYIPWYNAIDKANKWEDSDPPSDCSDGNITGTWNK